MPRERGLVREQGVVGNEEDGGAIVVRAIMTTPKIITLEPGDGLCIRIEHDFLVRTQPASQFREVNDDNAIWHDPLRAERCCEGAADRSKSGGTCDTHSGALSSGGLMCRNEYSSEKS